MPYAATWTDPEILILRGLSQRKTNIIYDITYMWNLKYGTNELIYKTEIPKEHLEIPREHFMQRWAQKRKDLVWT